MKKTPNDRLRRAIIIRVTEHEYKTLIGHSFTLGLSAWGREAIRREVYDPIGKRVESTDVSNRDFKVYVFVKDSDYLKALEKVEQERISISSWGRSVLLSQYEYDLEQMAKLDNEA